MSTVIQLLIVLGIMVLVHEFGHFAVAKLCGIRVEVFSIGFGKRLFGFRRGDTEYQISAIPLGGYVKMSGEMTLPTDAPGETSTAIDDPGNFNNHPRWQRILVALAGPIANFLLALGLMTGVYMLHNEVDEYKDGPALADYVQVKSPAAKTGIQSGDLIVHYDTIENPTWDDVANRSVLNLNQTIPFSFVHDGQRTDTRIFVESKGRPEDFSPFDQLGFIPKMQNTPVQVNSLEASMPATHAGLKVGDKIVSIDGNQLYSVAAILTYLQDQAGKTANLIVSRNGTNVSLQITPQFTDIGDGTKGYRLGFGYLRPPVKVERLPFPQAFGESVKFNKKGSLFIVEVLKRLFTHQVSVKSLQSPIGIGQQIHEAYEQPGWTPLIGTMSLISLNLGIFNLLPIPILDGGQIVMLLVEMVMQRDLSLNVKELVFKVGFVCIMLIVAFAIYNDISKLVPAGG
jgi:regulator of sigma E protease